MGEQPVTWRSELLLSRIEPLTNNLCITFLRAYQELEDELLAREAENEGLQRTVQGLSRAQQETKATGDAIIRQLTEQLQWVVLQMAELRAELMRVTQQELPFDE